MSAENSHTPVLDGYNPQKRCSMCGDDWPCDTARLDWLEENGIYVSLDGRKHDRPIGATRAAIDAAMEARR